MTDSLKPRRAIVVATAALAALVVWTLLDPVGGVALTVHSGQSTSRVGPVALLVVSVLAGLAGWAVLAWCERRARRPRRVWRVVAALAFAVSLLGPLGGTGTGARLGLLSLHATVAAVLIAGLPAARSRARVQNAPGGGAHHA